MKQNCKATINIKEAAGYITDAVQESDRLMDWLCEVYDGTVRESTIEGAELNSKEAHSICNALAVIESREFKGMVEKAIRARLQKLTIVKSGIVKLE